MHLRVDDEHDAAAAAAVTAVGAAERLELLAVDRGAAVAAVARPRVDDDAVDEPGHRTSFPVECEAVARYRSRTRSRFTFAYATRTQASEADRPNDVDGLAAALDAELDRTGGRGEQRVVAATADVDAGVEVGAALADEDLAGLDDLAAEPLDAEALGVGVATVA